MPVKQPEILSRADFDDAIVKLRLNVSEVAKQTSIPRSYLSEFRNGDRVLRPEHQAKLRDYFEAKGIEFTAATPEQEESTFASTLAPASPHPRLRAVESVRCFFPFADTAPDEVIARVVDLMEDNDARLAALLKQTTERDGRLLGDGDLTDEAKFALQEAGSLLAESYVLFRMLRGWPALGVKPAGESVETLRDVLLQLYRPVLEKAGLIEPQDDDQETDDIDDDDQSKAVRPRFQWVKGPAKEAA